MHVVYVNDTWLNATASGWKAGINFCCGLSVGLIIHGVTGERRAANADITYGTNNDSALPARQPWSPEPDGGAGVITPSWTVDSILIDEHAPLIISGEER